MNIKKMIAVAKQALDAQNNDEIESVDDGSALKRNHLFRDVHFTRQDVAMIAFCIPIGLVLLNNIVRLLWVILAVAVLILANQP